MTDSILDTTKKVLGIESSYTAFDLDVLMHVNSALATLNQLGIGPEEGFEIEDATAVWSDFLGTDKRYNPVKTYVYLRVRLLFDPPSTSFAIEAIKNQLQELEWRLNVHREAVTYPSVVLYGGFRIDSAENIALISAALADQYMTVVEAGTNLSAPRPVDAGAVYWKFSAGVVVGPNGTNIVNAKPGDTYHVASA